MSTPNSISQFVGHQIPEHIRDSGSMLPEFLTTYYKYVDQREKGNGLILNHSANIDIDRTLTKYIDKFYDQYGGKLPVETALNKRNFIKLLSQIYEAKGTDRAYKLLFKCLWGETIDVSYPGEKILRTSDGRWTQSSFIVVETSNGFSSSALPAGEFSALVRSDTNSFAVGITSTEMLDATFTRMLFQAYTRAPIEAGQEVLVYDSFGSVIFGGIVRATPSKLAIVSGGKNWKLGQVFVLKGSISDTICRVTNIGDHGICTGVEIIQYGWGHQSNQTFVVSPHHAVPPKPSVFVSSTVISTAPLVQEHTIEITDSTSYTADTTSGTQSQAIGNSRSYFAQDYLMPSYLGYEVLVQAGVSNVPSNIVIDYGLTYDEWKESLMTVRLMDHDLVKTRGYYRTDDSLISHSGVKLQDNFYYQMFSYLIETSLDTAVYKDAIDLLHPAGLKRFVSSNKNFYTNLQTSTSAERVVATI